MAKPIITGTLMPIVTGRRTNYDPLRGLVEIEDIETAGDNLSGVAQSAIDAQLPFDFTHQRAKARISVTQTTTFGGKEVTSDTWQIVGNEITEDIKRHPTIAALEETGNDSLKDVYDHYDRYTRDPATFTNTLTEGSTAAKLFNLLKRGTNSYLIGQYVLRHTTNVGNGYSVNVADENVECVYTTAQLVAEVSDADLWAFPCPGRLIYKIQNITPQFATDDELRWGWRKLPSTETTAANNRVDISTEYVLYGWSKLLYSAAS